MKIKPILHCTMLLLGASLASAHDHFAAGVDDLNSNGQPDPGEPLKLHGPAFSNKVFHLLPRPAGQRPAIKCGGHYALDEGARTLFPNDGFSFTALSDGQVEAEEENHAHTGAWIWMEILSVDGPAGAAFGFWEAGRSTVADTPTRSFITGAPTGAFRFILSGGIDSADEDPQGHIHGRAWTADKPGIYQITMRLVDRSTSGPGGGPWHAPGAPFVFRFEAGPDFQPSLSRSSGTSTLTWPSRMGIWEPFQTGILFRVLRSTDPAAGWTSIGQVTGTTAATISFTDPSPPAGRAFYRLSYDWAEPVQP